tara:strand:- start:2723 stop:3841 length:1119 start_codon:yes stop_codon:yes gene_type:complete
MKINVPIFDLRVTDQKLKKKLLQSVNKVLEHGKLFLGPEVEILEKKISKFLNTKYVLGVSSGSSAIYLALKASGIKKGDEVIVSPVSWIMPINAITLCGAKPVFADINDDLNINPKSVEEKITKKTKAILAMHYAGHMCDMKQLNNIAKKNNLFIIEDSAQAFGASINKKKSGTFSLAAGFSSNPMKPFNGFGESGFMVTNNKKLFNKAKILRHAGTTSDYRKKLITNNCIEPSLNHKMDTINASMLLVSLDNYYYKMKKIRKYAKMYENKLSSKISYQKINTNEVSGRYVFPIIVNKRNKLMQYLKNHGIETKIFNLPLAYNAPYYKKYKKEKLINAEKMINKILIIPCHDKLTINQVNYVVKCINKFYNK